MITYRAGEINSTLVAYANNIRIGYIDHNHMSRWTWNILSGLHPGHGRVHGVADSEVEARSQLESAFGNWVDAAGLRFAESQVDG